jgi:DNA-binding beta-propeller fold protein YncE
MGIRTTILLVVGVLLCESTIRSQLASQVATATISGAVSDRSGAALPGASVLIHSGLQRLATIAVPGEALSNFDIGWVDPLARRYYLTDMDNQGIDIIDTDTNAFVSRISGFVGLHPTRDRGHSLDGPNGELVIPALHQLWAGDADSTVKIVDLQLGKVIDTIATGGTTRADEIAFDDRDQVILIGNAGDKPPFVTFISTKPDHKILGKILFAQANGLEQPVWNRVTGRFYQAVTATTANPGGEIDAIDPNAMQVTDTIPLDTCNPHGMVVGPAQHLLVGCGTSKTMILDLRAPDHFVVFPQAGHSDEVWFNPGDDKYFLASSGCQCLSIIDADTNAWIGSVPTGPTAHSVAADPVTNRVYVPIAANPKDPACTRGCIAVFANPMEP